MPYPTAEITPTPSEPEDSWERDLASDAQPILAPVERSGDNVNSRLAWPGLRRGHFDWPQALRRPELLQLYG